MRSGLGPPLHWMLGRLTNGRSGRRLPRPAGPMRWRRLLDTVVRDQRRDRGTGRRRLTHRPLTTFVAATRRGSPPTAGRRKGPAARCDRLQSGLLRPSSPAVMVRAGRGSGGCVPVEPPNGGPAVGVRRKPVPAGGDHNRGPPVPAVPALLPRPAELHAERGVEVDHVTVQGHLVVGDRRGHARVLGDDVLRRERRRPGHRASHTTRWAASASSGNQTRLLSSSADS